MAPLFLPRRNLRGKDAAAGYTLILEALGKTVAQAAVNDVSGSQRGANHTIGIP